MLIAKHYSASSKCVLAFQIATVLTLCLALSACAGGLRPAGPDSGASLPDSLHQETSNADFVAAKRRQIHPAGHPAAGPATEAGAPIGASLPAVASLSRSASIAQDIALASGGEYDASLPFRSVSVTDSKLSFTPGGDNFGELAFAMYRFNLPSFSGTPQVETFWTTPPADGELFYAVADFAAQRWVWIAGGTGVSAQLPAGDYRNDSNEVFVVVVVKGLTPSLLDYLRFGGNVAPVPRATASPLFAMGAFSTTLSGALSSDVDGFISKWEWDLDNDGTFEVDGGNYPFYNFGLSAAADQVVGMRVTDDEGLTAATTLTLYSNQPGYDELEPNDTATAPANMLPPGAFIGWEGNIGIGGYDGDSLDVYGLVAPMPELVRISMTVLNTSNVPMKLTLLAPDGATVLLEGNEQLDHARLDALLPAAGTYVLLVETQPGVDSFDYVLDCGVSYYPSYSETENNDSPAEANVLSVDGVSDFRASLGDTGYDGDSEDFYRITGKAGEGCSIKATFPIAEADIDLELLAADGVTVVASAGNTTDMTEDIYFVFPDDQEYYLRCFIKAASPADAVADYYLDMSYLGQPPTAAVSISPDNGNAPLTITVDTSASVAAPDDFLGAVLIDWNSDGIDDFNAGAPGSFQVVLYEPRSYTITAKIIQGDGQFATAIDTVDVSGSVDESEYNNSFAEAQLLPSDNFSNFAGVIGPGEDPDGNLDFYRLTAGSNGVLIFDLDYENALGAGISLELYYMGDLVASDTSGGDHLQVGTGAVMGEEYYLLVGGNDYTALTSGYHLDCSIN